MLVSHAFNPEKIAQHVSLATCQEWVVAAGGPRDNDDCRVKVTRCRWGRGDWNPIDFRDPGSDLFPNDVPRFRFLFEIFQNVSALETGGFFFRSARGWRV